MQGFDASTIATFRSGWPKLLTAGENARQLLDKKGVFRSV